MPQYENNWLKKGMLSTYMCHCFCLYSRVRVELTPDSSTLTIALLEPRDTGILTTDSSTLTIALLEPRDTGILTTNSSTLTIALLEPRDTGILTTDSTTLNSNI